MKKLFTFFSIIIISVQVLNAQVDNDSNLFLELKKMDSLIFDRGFNHCDFEGINSCVSEDLEFYHDQGGVTEGKTVFINSLKQNICADPDRKPIRKLIANTLEVHPLYKNGVLYGAIQNGEHEFYIAEVGKEMYKASTAKFTHLWILEKEKWQLKRVLSYDHVVPK